jgi:hypothetical protein
MLVRDGGEQGVAYFKVITMPTGQHSNVTINIKIQTSWLYKNI